MRLLVTGGAGFIGSHLVERLAADDHDVVVLDNLSTGSRENLTGVTNVTLIEADLLDGEAVREAVEGCDCVTHLAAFVSVPGSMADPVRSAAVNIQGTVGLLDACRRARVRRLVFASSAAVYGEPDEVPITEAMSTAPVSPYGAHKLAGEHLLRVAAGSGGPDTVSFRFFNVYGPRQDPESDYAAVVPIFRKRCQEGQAPTIFGDGTQTRDFVHVSDVVEGLQRALFSDMPWQGQAFDLAKGEATTVTKLAKIIIELEGFAGEPLYSEARAGDIEHSVADVSRLEGAMGWTPGLSLEEGLGKS